MTATSNRCSCKCHIIIVPLRPNKKIGFKTNNDYTFKHCRSIRKKSSVQGR